MNYLVKFLNGPSALTQLDIVLTDFGLAGQHSKGGTPIFASPECFGMKTHESDVFSLGRVFLFTLLPKDTFLEWLYVPVKSSNDSHLIRTAIGQNGLLKLISKMIKAKSADRINVVTVKQEFARLKQQQLIQMNHQSITDIEQAVANNMNQQFGDYISDLESLITYVYELIYEPI